MKRLVSGIVVLLVGLLLYQFVHFYLEQRTIKKPTESTVPARAENSLESVRDLLRTALDYESFRTAVQQLNGYLERDSQDSLRTVTAEERQLLSKQYQLDDSELAEVGRLIFTPLDAHHLDFCFLLRDALRSLRVEQLEPLEQAATGFAWVMRQVRQVDGGGDLLPPDFVLRHGAGNWQERALVFVAVLEQLGLPGCLVALPGPTPGQPAGRAWVGALVNKQIYLFDTRLGLALPGPAGAGIATLAQLRADPKLLQPLAADAQHPYDIAAEDVGKAEVHVAASLASLAPRMRYLQELLAGTEGVRLGIDPAFVFKEFQGAAGTRVPVRVWNQPGSWNTPFRVERHFLPVDEGGMDTMNRRGQLEQMLVPRNYPVQLAQAFRPQADPGQRLLGLYAMPFLAFHTQARLSEELVLGWLPGLTQKSQDKEGKLKVAEVLRRERMPRDLALRGRFEEATAPLVAIRDELQRQKELVHNQGGLNAQVEAWCEQAKATYAAFFGAQREAQGSKRRAAADPAALQNLQQATKNVENLWQQSGPVIALIQAAAAEPMYREVIYQLALCKQEQAERGQARLDRSQRAGKSPSPRDAKAVASDWKSAANWWQRLLDDPGATEYASHARLLLARARLALGDRDLSRTLLVDLSGKLTPLEQTARLYLARDPTRR